MFIIGEFHCNRGSWRKSILKGTKLWLTFGGIDGREGTVLLDEKPIKRFSFKHLVAILDHSADAITTVDKRLRFTFWNKGAERMFGWRTEEVIGREMSIIVPEEREGEFREVLRIVEEKGYLEGYQTERITKEGRTVPVEITLTAVRDEGGIEYSAIHRDISKRKKLERELQRSLDNLRKILNQTVNALASAMELRDPYTAGHQRRVTQLVCAIAQEMGLDEEMAKGTCIAASLHDVGKIHIPIEILATPTERLTEIELKMIKTHPRFGYEILKTIEFPWPVAEIVLQHHERMDGSGYPAGLRGEDILLQARILAVADVVEAMNSHRPYRSAHGMKKALKEISENRGLLYDPDVVDACVRVISEKKFQFDS